jgi:uridylate kinase
VLAAHDAVPMQAPVLLKLSGEALKGVSDGVFDRSLVDRFAAEIYAASAAGVRVAVVVGGGNILRGRDLGQTVDPTRGDHMGMLATLINALALRDGIERAGGRAEVVGPHAIPQVCHGFRRDQVLAWLDAGTVVVFGGGSGHPFFSTDTAAALRAAEIGASVVLKASGVDGVYSADPRKDPTARRFERLSFDDAIAGRYAVMDLTAFALCRERDIPIRIFDGRPAGALRSALGPDPQGTLVHP